MKPSKIALLCALVLCGQSLFGQTNFTDFFCNPSGDNLNSGSTSNTAAAVTYPSGTWVAATGIFTPASGNPVSDGLTNGGFVSIYTNGETRTAFVAMITNVTSSTVTVSLTTAFSGTVPSDGALTRTLKSGGAWAGPNGGAGLPFNFILGSLTNTSGYKTRVNFVGTYPITNSIIHNVGPSGAAVIFRGYTNSPGDGGRCVFDGGLSGASYLLFSNATLGLTFHSIIFTNNGGTGALSGVNNQALYCIYRNCIFANMALGGIIVNSQAQLTECGAYNNNRNTNNSSFGAGFYIQSIGTVCTRCVSSNPNAKGIGFGMDTPVFLEDCIAYKNGSNGVIALATTSTLIKNSIFYGNGGAGINLQALGAGVNNQSVLIENCAVFKNGEWGINWRTNRSGGIWNCAFGSGTQANTSGDITGDVFTSGNVTYPANLTPWVDPENGNFTVTNTATAIKYAGRGRFGPQANGAESLTVGYSDIGAAQATNAPSGGSSPFVQ